MTARFPEMDCSPIQGVFPTQDVAVTEDVRMNQKII